MRVPDFGDVLPADLYKIENILGVKFGNPHQNSRNEKEWWLVDRANQVAITALEGTFYFCVYTKTMVTDLQRRKIFSLTGMEGTKSILIDNDYYRTIFRLKKIDCCLEINTKYAISLLSKCKEE